MDETVIPVADRDMSAGGMRSLLQRGNAFSKRLLSMPFDRGGFFLPKLEDRSRSATQEWLAARLSQALRESPSRCVMLEDQLAKAGDPFLRCAGLPFVTFDGTVVYRLTEAEAEQSHVLQALHFATSYILVAALVEGAEQTHPDAVLEVYVGPCGGERLTIWRRTR
jgi:hypothetical protein